MVIGITGGVGCGKTTVMSVLRERFAAKTLLADEIGHMALQPGEKTYEKICTMFGSEVVLPTGQLNRTRLAELIYADEEKRQQLNAIVHPYVKRKIQEYLQEWRDAPLVAIETALMFESGCDAFCDAVWYVKTEPMLRIQRLMESRGYTKQKAEAIMAAQISDEEGCRRCDACIENNGSIEKIANTLQELLGIS